MDKASARIGERAVKRVFSVLVWATVVLGLVAASAGCGEPARKAGPSPISGGTASNAPASRSSPTQTAATQIILDGLGDPDPSVRAKAVEVVVTTGQLRLMPKVQKLLRDPSVPVRFLSVLAVGDVQYALAKPDVTLLLRDEDENVRIGAAYAMTRFGHAEFYKMFRDAVTSQNQTVRANAALLLGKSGNQEAVDILYWTLRDKNSADKVVLQAAESIAMLKDEQIYPKLWSRLISAYADDRVIGIQGMGALGTDQAKGAIATMLKDSVVEVRLAAAEELGKLNEPLGENEVARVFKENLLAGMDAEGQERVKVLAALAIGEIGTEPLVRHLPVLLRDESKVVRLAAAKAVLRSSFGK